jgi:hypothetical protein
VVQALTEQHQAVRQSRTYIGIYEAELN